MDYGYKKANNIRQMIVNQMLSSETISKFYLNKLIKQMPDAESEENHSSRKESVFFLWK
jgi:hypothetical protein